MVVLAISSIVAYATFVAFRSGDVQYQTSQVTMTIQDSAREGLYKMIQEIRHSSPTNGNIVIEAGSIRFDIPNPTNPVQSDYTENWGDPKQIQYALSGTQIIRTNLTPNSNEAPQVMANDVTALSFTQAGNILTASVSVQRQLVNGRSIPTQPVQMSVQTELRNS